MQVNDENIKQEIENACKKHPLFMYAYKALQYRLQTSSSKLGKPTGEGLPIVCRLHKQPPDVVAKTPRIKIIISYHDSVVHIN